MPRERLYDVLEECLAQLKQGVGLEDVLAQHQQLAKDLRPLLETAVMAQPSRIKASSLHTAQVRSRARFLGAASQRQPVSLFRSLRLASMRLAAAVALVVVIFTVSLVGSGLASAKSVPGQALYPVKRAVEQAQLALTTSQVNRIDLEESFDQRRAQEAEQLIQTGKTEEVKFAGYLREDPQAGWVVDQSVLILTPDQKLLAESLVGSYVEVAGTVRGESGVQVNTLQLRLFQVSGLLQSIQGSDWVVSGIHVQVQEQTKVMGNPRIGSKVEISAARLSDGQFLALTAKFKQGGLPKKDDEDKKPTAENEVESETPEAEATVTNGGDDHGGGKDKPNADPTETPEPDTDEESTPDQEAVIDSTDTAQVTNVEYIPTMQTVSVELTEEVSD